MLVSQQSLLQKKAEKKKAEDLGIKSCSVGGGTLLSVSRPQHEQDLGHQERADLIKTMPSLPDKPPNQHRCIMEQGDRTRNNNIGKNFMCRLQCMFSHPSSTESLSLEDTQQWAQSLERLLESKYGLATFHTFLKSEFSDENIAFWLTCEDYKQIKSSFKMSSKAKKIYEQFIKAESPREINIDYHTREQIKRSVKTPTEHCFDDAQKIVYGLMERDSYPRFLRSDMYKILLENLAADDTNL